MVQDFGIKLGASAMMMKNRQARRVAFCWMFIGGSGVLVNCSGLTLRILVMSGRRMNFTKSRKSTIIMMEKLRL